jgi:tetratricopeptide (TPR) repeat protein
MSDFKIQNALMNHYADRIKPVNPADPKTANVKYVDLNNNGQKDTGELLSENSNSDEFLKNIIYREKDVIKMQKVYEIVATVNSRTNALQNELESKLILKAALVVNEVPEAKIAEYIEKFDRLYMGYVQYKIDNNLHPSNKFQEIECLNKYLWKNGHLWRAVEQAFMLDKVIDNQLAYLADKYGRVEVGNCEGLTMLFNIMAVRAGIPAQSVFILGHIFSLYESRVIENTVSTGNNSKVFSKDNVVSAYKGIAASFYNIGFELSKKKEYDKAILAYEKAILLHPKYTSAYINIGFMYSNKKDYDKAIQFYEQALKVDPTRTSIYIDIGGAYVLKKDYDKAIEIYKYALHVDPQNSSAYNKIGIVYMMKGEFAKAMKAFKKEL